MPQLRVELELELGSDCVSRTPEPIAFLWTGPGNMLQFSAFDANGTELTRLGLGGNEFGSRSSLVTLPGGSRARLEISGAALSFTADDRILLRPTTFQGFDLSAVQTEAMSLGAAFTVREPDGNADTRWSGTLELPPVPIALALLEARNQILRPLVEGSVTDDDLRDLGAFPPGGVLPAGTSQSSMATNDLPPIDRASLEPVASDVLEAIVRDFASIEPGVTTRREVQALLQSDGGLSVPSQGRFVHPLCRYCKVLVSFDVRRDGPGGQGRALSGEDDVVTEVSWPYLERRSMD